MVKKRPKLKDIAELAGVSTATVDRVLNNRTGVQNHTRRHVLSIVSSLSCREKVDPAPDPTDWHNPLSFDFVVPDNGNTFMTGLIFQLENYARKQTNITLKIHRPKGVDAKNIVETLAKIGANSQGVGLIGLDRPLVRDAIRNLVEQDIPVITMASDIRAVPRLHYVGIDNYSAGRLAGFLTGRMVEKSKGKVALFLGSRAYFGHEEREMGFRGILREAFPGLRIAAEREIQEDAKRARKFLLEEIDQHPDLAAVYCIGAGQSGIAKAIEESGCRGSVFYVGHGLTSETRRFLIDGTMDVVIDEDTLTEAQQAIDCLTLAARGLTPKTPSTIRINAIFQENVPAEVGP